MLQYLFDTDHLTLFDHSDPVVWRHFMAHPQDTVGLSAVSVEEYLRGRLAGLARHQHGPRQVTAYAHLVETLDLFQHFLSVPFDLASETCFQHLRGQRIRIGTQDLRIAAVALTNGVPLVTRNRRDFALVPGLVLEDWSV